MHNTTIAPSKHQTKAPVSRKTPSKNAQTHPPEKNPKQITGLAEISSL
jgi:hypothetical protein